MMAVHTIAYLYSYKIASAPRLSKRIVHGLKFYHFMTTGGAEPDRYDNRSTTLTADMKAGHMAIKD
jgi:hypothetical protein